jgi:Mg/Co/Ni transporter MgtE
METDEAVEALRDLADEERDELLGHMNSERAAELSGMLAYEEDTAGGIMTTSLAVAHFDDTVEALRGRLRELADHRGELDGVAVVDADGLLVDDLTLFDLLIADPNTTVGDLVGEETPLTVGPDESIRAVAAQLTEARRSSVLVVEEGRPIGRILADDVVDALLPERGRLHFPRFLQ